MSAIRTKKNIVLPPLPEEFNPGWGRAIQESIRDVSDNAYSDFTARYDTGWVACSDWTGQSFGTALGGFVYHGLGAWLPHLSATMFSSLGDDEYANVILAGTSGGDYGVGISQVSGDNNSILVKSGANGIILIASNGSGYTLAAQPAFYKIVVVRNW